jgi:hypothetical protein
MTPSFLPGLDPETQRREKVRKRVRPASIAQYTWGRINFKGRNADALRGIAAYFNLRQDWPTAVEVTHQLNRAEWAKWSKEKRTIQTLRISRAISALQTKGVVEKNGDRFCCVSDKVLTTWRVVEAGRG